MNLYHVFLKLIQQLQLVDQDSFRQLKVDVLEWESTAVIGSEDKIKHFYGKIHQGVHARLIMVFLYYYLFKVFRSLTSSQEEAEF